MTEGEDVTFQENIHVIYLRSGSLAGEKRDEDLDGFTSILSQWLIASSCPGDLVEKSSAKI